MIKFLKEGTTSIHSEVEQTNLAKHIMDHSITPEVFKRLLIQNYYAYYTIEKQLQQNTEKVSSNLKAFIDTKKSRKLLKDLNNLDNTFKAISLENLNFKIESELDAIGALYVIEGSMLGGLLISKHLDHCSNLSNIKTQQFFKSDPKNSMMRWKNFTTTVNEMTFTEDQKQSALQTAKKTFQVFNSCQKRY